MANRWRLTLQQSGPPREPVSPIWGQNPVLGRLDGTYLGRLVVEAWQPYDPTMTDGLWFAVSPVDAANAIDQANNFARQAVTKLGPLLARQQSAPPTLSHRVSPTLGRLDDQGGGRFLGVLVVELWQPKQPTSNDGVQYAVGLADDAGVAPHQFAVDTVNRLRVRLARQQQNPPR